MKVIVILTALSLSSAMAQFDWDNQPATGSVPPALDRFDAALRAPVIEPITPPVEVDPLVEQCDLEPEVAQVYRAAEIVEDDGDGPKLLGRLSANPYASTSINNPYATYGSRFSPPKYEQPLRHAGTVAVRGLN